VLYYDQDQLGSTRVLTDSSGNVAATYSYDAYGNSTGTTGTVVNPFRYAGQYQDSESGFYYLRSRYYDPVTAQFISIDPFVGVTQSAYGYADSDPLNQVDPLGLWGWNPISDISQAAGDVGAFTAHHYGDILTGAAVATVFIPGVDLVDIAIVGGVALTARIANRSTNDGSAPWSSENLGPNLADSIVTAGSFGLIATPISVAEPLFEELSTSGSWLLRSRLALPDAFGFGLGLSEGCDS